MSQLNRTVLVSGASSGIGRAVCENLLQQGHKVIGLSRTGAQFNVVPEQYSHWAMDLSALDTLPAALQKLQSRHPDLDSVVFCAGMGRFASLEEFSTVQIQQLIDLNLTSQILMARTLLPGLKHKAHGDMVFIGSEAALKGSRKGTVYCATKFALRGFTQALREECGKSRVRVSLINPGLVDTAFFEHLDFKPGSAPNQALTAGDVAQSVGYILRARPGIVIDEINLNPANKVIEFKK